MDRTGTLFACNLYSRCISQILPALGILLILTSSAMPYGWIICQRKYPFDGHLYMAWFIGGIMGGVGSGVFARIVRKRIFIWASGILAFASSLLFIYSTEFLPIIKTPYLSGIAYGLLFIPGLIYIGEIAEPRIRGMLCGLVALGQPLAGSLASAEYYVTINRKYSFEFTLGVVSMTLAFIGLFLCICPMESPVYLIMKQRNKDALQSLTYFRRNMKGKDEIQDELNDIIAMVTESHAENRSFLGGETMKPLIRIVLMRLLCAFTLTIHLVRFLTYVVSHTPLQNDNSPFWSTTCIRLALNIFHLFLIDTLGAKLLLVLSLLLSGCSLIVLISLDLATEHAFPVHVTLGLFLLYQVTTGFGLDTVTSTYLSVSFSPWTKPYLICLTFVSEMLLNICTMVFHKYDYYMEGQFFFYGISATILGLAFTLGIPDVTNLTLRKCHKAMQTMRGS